tara:strand:- start:265 stop:435 length:171 start_codon:yes stop_codon:yes gene_type:complete
MTDKAYQNLLNTGTNVKEKRKKLKTVNVQEKMIKPRGTSTKEGGGLSFTEYLKKYH